MVISFFKAIQRFNKIGTSIIVRSSGALTILSTSVLVFFDCHQNQVCNSILIRHMIIICHIMIWCNLETNETERLAECHVVSVNFNILYKHSNISGLNNCSINHIFCQI